jgi:ribosomal protein RSM22 (predicted rRNA methylase)
LNAVSDQNDIAAYLTARLPATYAATRAALTAVRMRAPAFHPHSLLDFGAGPGTASWAATEIWPGIESVAMQDHNAHFVEAARALVANSPHPALRQAQITTAVSGGGKFDLIIAGYVISEIAESRVAEIVSRLWSVCRGILVIVEPGTPAGFQRVLHARQALLQTQAMIAAPCPGEVTCPMAGGDWCHFTVRLPRTRDHMRAKNANVPFEDEKFSYVAAARAGMMLTAPAPRIVAPVMTTKAGSRFPLCTQHGISEVDIPRRDPAEYRRHRRKNWGDVF